MSNSLEGHKDSVGIRGRSFINFRFEDDFVVNAEEEEEADRIVTSMNTTCIRYKMEIGHDKTKI